MEGKEAESSQIYEHLSPIRNKIATAETSQYKITSDRLLRRQSNLWFEQRYAQRIQINCPKLGHAIRVRLRRRTGSA